MLVRHGETVGQSSIRLYGATDVELAPEGEVQVAAAGRALSGQRFDAVVTSPLRRARRSAEVLLEACAHPPVELEIVEGFREVDFGAWEGWTWAEVQDRDPEGHARWRSEGENFCFPEGESRRAFLERVQGAVGPAIEARYEAGAERVLAVVHKGVIKAIVARLLERPIASFAQWSPELGSVHRMRWDRSWSLDDLEISA